MRRVIVIAVAGTLAAAIFVFAGDETLPPVPQREGPAAIAERSSSPAELLAAVVASARDADSLVVQPAEAPRDASLPFTASLEALTDQLVALDAGSVASEPPTPLTPDAGRRKPRDKRFGVRWDDPGLCDDEPRLAMAERRAELLARFTDVRRGDAIIFRDPHVPVNFANAIGDSLLVGRQTTSGLLGSRATAVPFPVIYVYESAEQLRSVACVNTATAGYDDGAIHLPASDPELHRTVVHELTHHVLRTLGVTKPMWFHEGLAMYAADERWWEDPRSGLVAWLQREHLPFHSLTEAFPHTADELFAGAVYFQSFQMVRFLGARAGQPDFGWFVDGLSSGAFEPQTAFSVALGLDDATLEREWQRFVRQP